MLAPPVPLANAPILVICDHPEISSALVVAISAAGGDVVYAGDAFAIRQRLKQFRFAAIVIGPCPREVEVAALVQAKDVPYCRYGDGSVSEVVPALVALLK